MKKVFLRILSLAAAVLFATSCSKEENSDNDEPVNNGQETVVTQEKTVTVTGTLSKKSGISKISCADGENLTFDGNETLVFSGDDGKIHGSTTLTEAGETVDFSVELSYQDEAGYVLDGKTVTATIGTAPTDVTGPYSSLDAATKTVYEVSAPVTINASGDDFSFANDIVMNVNVAFVKNDKTPGDFKEIWVSVNDGVSCMLSPGEIYIVPVDVKLTAGGKTKNQTVAGEIYTISDPVAVTGVTIINAPSTKVWGNNAFKLTANVTPTNATNKKFTWSCTTDNATITEDDEILITGTDTVTIVATTDDGHYTDQCDITVPTAYVDLLGTGTLYWYTEDLPACLWKDRTNNLPDGARVPEPAEFNQLVTVGNEVNYYDHDYQNGHIVVINRNGSGAKISISNDYWTNRKGAEAVQGDFVQFSYNPETGVYSRGNYGWCYIMRRNLFALSGTQIKIKKVSI